MIDIICTIVRLIAICAISAILGFNDLAYDGWQYWAIMVSVVIYGISCIDFRKKDSIDICPSCESNKNVKRIDYTRHEENGEMAELYIFQCDDCNGTFTVDRTYKHGHLQYITYSYSNDNIKQEEINNGKSKTDKR